MAMDPLVQADAQDTYEELLEAKRKLRVLRELKRDELMENTEFKRISEEIGAKKDSRRIIELRWAEKHPEYDTQVADLKEKIEGYQFKIMSVAFNALKNDQRLELYREVRGEQQKVDVIFKVRLVQQSLFRK